MTRVATPQFQFRQGEDVFIRIRRVQRGGHITLSATVGTTGNFTLTWGGRTTTALDVTATGATLQAALSALPSIGGGNITVTGAAGGPWDYLWTGRLSGTTQPYPTAAWTLSDPAGVITIEGLARDITGYSAHCVLRNTPAGAPPYADVTNGAETDDGRILIADPTTGELIIWFKASKTVTWVWSGAAQIDLAVVNSVPTPPVTEVWFMGKATLLRSVIPA